MDSILIDKNGISLFVGDKIDSGHGIEQIKSIKMSSENGLTKVTLAITNSLLGGISTIDFPINNGQSTAQAKLYTKILD